MTLFSSCFSIIFSLHSHTSLSLLQSALVSHSHLLTHSSLLSPSIHTTNRGSPVLRWSHHPVGPEQSTNR